MFITRAQSCDWSNHSDRRDRQQRNVYRFINKVLLTHDHLSVVKWCCAPSACCVVIMTLFVKCGLDRLPKLDTQQTSRGEHSTYVRISCLAWHKLQKLGRIVFITRTHARSVLLSPVYKMPKSMSSFGLSVCIASPSRRGCGGPPRGLAQRRKRCISNH